MHDWAEFRHFWYLLTILEKGGFRLAAEELHTSQPNLTVQARQFQERASISLYRKAKDGRIQPTETGRAFIALARSVLEVRDETIEALMAIERGELSSVRLGCSPLVDQTLFRTLCTTHKNLLPGCAIRPNHGDMVQLVAEVLSGSLDAAVVTLPLKHPDLRIEVLSQDRLVVCLRRDHPLAQKQALHLSDLHDNLAVLYNPIRHPEAHTRLLEMLDDQGMKIDEYSSASHPSEMQMLVKEGYGFALIREGTPLDAELTTRRIAGVSWTVDTALVFHRQTHPKTIPLLLKKLRRMKQQTDRRGSLHLVETAAPAVQLPLIR